LPIEDALLEIEVVFRSKQAAVLVAPPGAGKSTRVPLFLRDVGFLKAGGMLLLQPRRAAARAVAGRMAALIGERVGDTVGYHIRFDKCASKDTRILVITEGILTRRMILDPFLEGTSFVVLDEFHERSVHSDLALSFVKELLDVREDLRLLVMSATLDATRVSDFLNGCPIIKSEGRMHPLTVSFAAEADDRPLDIRASRAVKEAIRTAPNNGDVLVFMQGEGEIRRLMNRLQESELPCNPEVLPLFSALPAKDQDRALFGGDRRRVIIATNIAETSLTIPKITSVVDLGLRKMSRFDPKVGLDRLETVCISRASADQRAGRAGRIGPGHVVRLWTLHEHKGRPVSDTPEILLVDTAPVLLQLIAFRQGDPSRTDLLDRPDASHLEAGLDLLQRLGALNCGSFQLTDKGRRLAMLPLHPRLGAILLDAEAQGNLEWGATVAALASEQDIIDRTAMGSLSPSLEIDFDYRLSLFQEYEADTGGIRDDFDGMIHRRAAAAVEKTKRALISLFDRPSQSMSKTDCTSAGRLLLSGFPDRVARLRPNNKKDALMVGKKGVSFARPNETGSDLIVVVNADAGERSAASSGRIRSAVEITLEDLEEQHPSLLSKSTRAVFNPKTETVATWEETRFIDLVVKEKPAALPDKEAVAEALAQAAIDRWQSLFSPDKETASLLDRIRFAVRVLPQYTWPDASEDGLKALLKECCVGLQSLDQVRRIDWKSAVLNRMDYSLKALLDREIPERIVVPSGSEIKIVYEASLTADGPPPHIACRIQELFGLMDTPRIAEGKVALVIHLLAPNMRPCQVTQDLKSFWQNTYLEVRKELKGRYPKHYWPENPYEAEPTSRVRPRHLGFK
jgi:ATP-dependent helicase HrpB